MDLKTSRSIMASLRTAREPILEPVLYERVAARVGQVEPERFLAVLERLLMQGHVRLSVARDDAPRRVAAPFQARYYRPAD